MLSKAQIEDNEAEGRRDPVLCALTGKPTQPGDIGIPLTPRYGVWVRAAAWRGLTDEERAAMIDQWRGDMPKDAPTANALLNAAAYEDMPIIELRRQAEARGVELSGARSKEEIASRLRAADVRARFSGGETVSDATSAPTEEG